MWCNMMWGCGDFWSSYKETLVELHREMTHAFLVIYRAFFKELARICWEMISALNTNDLSAFTLHSFVYSSGPHNLTSSFQASMYSSVGEGSPALCQMCMTALQALVTAVYLVLMLRMVCVGVCGRWWVFKRNAPSCWEFGLSHCQPVK